MLTRSRKWKASEDTFLAVVQCVADNGWVPVWTEEHGALRLVSTGVKFSIDATSQHEFKSIVNLLDERNRLDSPFCHYCDKVAPKMSYEEFRKLCKTCNRINFGPETCRCKESHCQDPRLQRLDPRQDPNIEFCSTPPREQATRLLKFHRLCVANFLSDFADEDLSLAEPIMWHVEPLMHELKTYNLDIYNFLHNLLFIGWANKELSWSYHGPTDWSIYRDVFLEGSNDEGLDWHSGHRESFHDMLLGLVNAHKPDEDEEIVFEWMSEGLTTTASQLEYIPEGIRRCIENSRDEDAEKILGPSVASSIDMFRTARGTLKHRKLRIDWMPCLGGDEETYVPRESFQGYDPRTSFESLGCDCASNRILGSSLDPSLNGYPVYDPKITKPEFLSSWRYCWKRN